MSSNPRLERAWSLAARMTAWYVGSAFLLVFVATGTLYWALVSHLDNEDDAFLADRARLIAALLADGDVESPLLQRAATEQDASPFGQMKIRVLDDRGRTLLETTGLAEELATGAFPQPAPLGNGPIHGSEAETPAGKAYRLVAVRTGPDTRAFVIQLAFDRTAEEALLARYRRNLWLVLAAALIGCGVVGYYVIRRGLRPLAAITAAAQRVESKTLHERLHLGPLPAELTILAATFNAMLDRLENSFRRLDRFAADIAHELRTPVNNLRGEAEVALGQVRSPAEYREVLGSSLEECGRLAHLIDSLLFLARAEHPETQIVREKLDIAHELQTICDFFEAAASDAGIRLELQAKGPLPANLDKDLFHRAVSNLVANALAHTPAGGKVTLSAVTEPSNLIVTIADTGPGIPAEHLNHVFDRFYRADPARTTSAGRVGLGLAIVKSIAEMHGGSAEIASPVGKGTRVTLHFPAAANSRARGEI